MAAVVTALHVYPVKSCRGIAVAAARLTPAGLEHDRRFMIVTAEGRFVTQRERPGLARIGTALDGDRLVLEIPGAPPLAVEGDPAAVREVVVWRDRCRALDCGEEVAARLEGFLGAPARLVEFDPAGVRRSDPAWTGGLDGRVRFGDGFALLLTAEESLADLNARLPRPVPMDRFRPNVVIRGLGPFAEDAVGAFVADGLDLRPVKPCARCRITTTDQATGEVADEEPLRTLRTYRFDPRLPGIAFGQNVVVAVGEGRWLRVGERLEVRRRTGTAA